MMCQPATISVDRSTSIYSKKSTTAHRRRDGSVYVVFENDGGRVANSIAVELNELLQAVKLAESIKP